MKICKQILLQGQNSFVSKQLNKCLIYLFIYFFPLLCHQPSQEFNTKQLVKLKERDAVASLFPPPTANQSWRKVLSMGNLLNGHEPALREIIFSVYDTVSNNHYGSSNRLDVTGNIETHRMYICGTSNDLQVALSVTSWDQPACLFYETDDYNHIGAVGQS